MADDGISSVLQQFWKVEEVNSIPIASSDDVEFEKKHILAQTNGDIVLTYHLKTNKHRWSVHPGIAQSPVGYKSNADSPQMINFAPNIKGV